uniref:RdRp n=1 Tax=viral metagenome TaxID=1070528 RepID=A0A2V0R951_9ZZZZ
MISGKTYTDNLASFNRWLERLSRPETQDLRSAIWKNTPAGAPEGGWSRGECQQAFLNRVSLQGPRFSPHMAEREQKELERFLLPWSERPAWKDWGPQTAASYYGPWQGALSTLEEDMSDFRRDWGVIAKPYPFRKAASRLPRSTSSGLPWLTSGWMSNVGGAVVAETQAQWTLDNPRPIPPSMPMWRVDPPGKVRLAWAESKYEALYGAPFIYPIQDAMRKRAVHPFEAWEGQNKVAASLTADLKANPDAAYLSCDYSAFDQSQSPDLVRTVLNDLVHPMIGGIKPRMFETWSENLISGELITPDKVYVGEHEVPSGSVATNFIDSINNALCITGYIRNYGIKNSRYWVQGDDAVIRGEGVEPKDFAEFAQSEYGFKAHPDKQLFGRGELDFLQFSYYGENDYLPTYPVSRVGWRTIGHERYTFDAKEWNEWAVIVRALQQANNAIDNPSVDGLVSWMAQGDSKQLGANLKPKTVFQLSGKAGIEMTSERSRWDPGAAQGNWDVLPIQSVVRKVITGN